MTPLLLLRWAGRDLRHRWLQVAAISLIIAIGTGAYAALGSTATWRRQSNDDSFSRLAMYDVRVRVAEGVDASEGSLAARLAAMRDPSLVAETEERLVVATQVEASNGDDRIRVPGRIVSVDVRAQGPHVNRLWVGSGRGRALQADDDGAMRVVLERSFASFHELPVSGQVRVGGVPVQSVGHALAPEYFLIVAEEGGFFAQSNFGVAFAPLHTAQVLAGKPGRVNDLLVRLRAGADPAAAVAQIETAFAGSGLGVTLMTPRDEDAYRLLYDDIESDQKFWNVFAGLILAGATFGAFNLISRMVEAQRREIGIGMALGIPARRLMLRPLLAGSQIALLGVVLGVLVGFAVAAALRPVYTSMLPLPVWHTALVPSVFIRGALLGVLLPVLATAWPVWRAVRVSPVDAIATTHRTARGGLSPLLRRLPWPRATFNRMPLGNVLRTPRRTLLTALGVAAAMTALVSTLGMLDSFLDTMDRNDREVLQDHPDRVAVALRGAVPANSTAVEAVRSLPSVDALQPVLRFGGRLRSDRREPVEVFVDVTELRGTVWSPTLEQGALGPDAAGLVISREAAKDLQAGPGDAVVLEYPRPTLRGGVELTELRTRVTAVHPSPMRFNVFADRSQLSTLGYPDLVNNLYVLPAAHATAAEVQDAVSALPGVTSAQPVQAASQILKDSLDQFVGIFRVLEGFIFLLALLMAYNATRINADERRREHATLFAFGVRVRRVLRMEVLEAVLVGVLGTAIGLAAGVGVLGWMTTALIGNTMPELGLDVTLSQSTIVTAVALGVVAVGVAPLLTVRRLRAMNLPSTLRVVE